MLIDVVLVVALVVFLAGVYPIFTARPHPPNLAERLVPYATVSC